MIHSLFFHVISHTHYPSFHWSFSFFSTCNIQFFFILFVFNKMETFLQSYNSFSILLIFNNGTEKWRHYMYMMILVIDRLWAPSCKSFTINLQIKRVTVTYHVNDGCDSVEYRVYILKTESSSKIRHLNKCVYCVVGIF